MKCPSCKEEMRTGFVRAVGSGGICWVNEKVNHGASASADGFFPIGKTPWLRADCIPAHNCDSCKMIIIDYSAL